MFLVGVSLGRAGAGSDRAFGAVGGADQALHSVEQVSYIIGISAHDGYFCSEK